MLCARTVLAPVYLGRDNVINLVLEADGSVLADLSAVTRVIVDLDGGTTVIDSNTAAQAVRWTDSQMDRGQSVNVLSLQLGGEAIPAGTYDDVTIVVYDATYTDGLRVENDITITVHA